MVRETSEIGWTSSLRMLKRNLNAVTQKLSIIFAKQVSSTVRTGLGPMKAKNSMLLSKGKYKLARWAKHSQQI